MPTHARCWLCPLVHRDPHRIFFCRACGQALCAGSIFVRVGRFPYSHRDEHGIYCGPVREVGTATDPAEVAEDDLWPWW
jgi:hypothetical protein